MSSNTSMSYSTSQSSSMSSSSSTSQSTLPSVVPHVSARRFFPDVTVVNAKKLGFVTKEKYTDAVITAKVEIEDLKSEVKKLMNITKKLQDDNKKLQEQNRKFMNTYVPEEIDFSQVRYSLSDCLVDLMHTPNAVINSCKISDIIFDENGLFVQNIDNDNDKYSVQYRVFHRSFYAPTYFIIVYHYCKLKC